MDRHEEKSPVLSPRETLSANLTPRPVAIDAMAMSPSAEHHSEGEIEEVAQAREPDRFHLQAEAMIHAIADDRRALQELKAERDHLRDVNATAMANLRAQEATIKRLEGDLTQTRAMVDSWQGEAMRLQAAIEISVGSLLAATKREA